MKKTNYKSVKWDNGIMRDADGNEWTQGDLVSGPAMVVLQKTCMAVLNQCRNPRRKILGVDKPGCEINVRNCDGCPCLVAAGRKVCPFYEFVNMTRIENLTESQDMKVEALPSGHPLLGSQNGD